MKQPPKLKVVQANMREGLIARDGFLGTDTRALVEILDHDDNVVKSLGLTHWQIAQRMDHFTQEGRKGLGTTVEVDGNYEVRVQSVRGAIPCPWGHKGLYPKVNVWLKNLTTDDEMIWTALNSHLIQEHGFYQGIGSPFRIDPVEAKRALGL
ncbi:MAG: hypothetical protein ACYS8K_00795 [Planctomycetota bacterium]|jgi:hypothetical protein